MVYRVFASLCIVFPIFAFRLKHRPASNGSGWSRKSSITHFSKSPPARIVIPSGMVPGAAVEYYSGTQSRWVSTVITKVNSNGIELQHKPGDPVKFTDIATKLRTPRAPVQHGQQALPSREIRTTAQSAVVTKTKLAWHFEAETEKDPAIVACSANLFSALAIRKVSEWCCQISDGYYMSPFVPKHCYTVLHLIEKSAPGRNWWVILELFSSDEHGSEEDGDATIACAATNKYNFNAGSAAKYSHVCHKKGFPQGSVNRVEEDPKNILDFEGVHTWTDQYVRDHPEYHLSGDNCQMYSISLFNAITGRNYRRKQAFQARALSSLPNGTLDMIESSVAYSGSNDGSDDEQEEQLA